MSFFAVLRYHTYKKWIIIRKMKFILENSFKTSKSKNLWFRRKLIILEYTGHISPSQPRRMGYPFGLFPTYIGLRGGWWSAGPVKNIQHIWCLQKKSKWNVSKSDSENEAVNFPRFIVIESLEEVCLAKFSPFLIEKVISAKASLKTLKKTRNGNLLVEVDSQR